MLGSLDIVDEEADVLALIDKLRRDPAVPARLEACVGRKRALEIAGWCDAFPRAAADELEPVLAACEDLGLDAWLEPDFAVVRGLAYYTGPVWEVFDRRGALRAVAGGGRYDELIGSLGGPDLPAAGFGFGDMVVGELLTTLDLWPDTPPRVDVVVLPIGAEMAGPARSVLRRLRRAGRSAEAPYAPLSGARVAKALKAADGAGARHAVVVGPDEWAEGTVQLKDLASRDERVLDLEALEAWARE